MTISNPAHPSSEIRYLLVTSICILLSGAIASCGGGGGGSSSSGSTPPPDDTTTGVATIDFLPQQEIASTRANVSTDTGAELTLAGASLSIPAGALSDDGELELVAMSSRARELSPSDGALAGLTPISDMGYLIRSDEDLSLDETIYLRIPISLPAGTAPEDIRLATERGGYLIEQQIPFTLADDLTHITVELGAAALNQNPEVDLEDELEFELDGFVSIEDPMPSGIVLGSVALFTGGLFGLNPLVATIKSTGFDSITSDQGHFTVKYRSELTSVQEARSIAAELEEAYSVFVDKMGFSLPNITSLISDNYTVVLDDIRNHKLVTALAGGASPNGFTLNGSSLFGGISFVSTQVTGETRLVTAVHEYFHALEIGAVTSPFISSLGNNQLNPNDRWLFEGAAAALAARVVLANDQQPALDPSLPALTSGLALYNPEHSPATEVTQEFLVFLERGFGSTDFYLELFENLSPLHLDSRPASIIALDNLLQEWSDGEDSLTDAWEEFVEDRVMDNPGGYIADVPPATVISLNRSSSAETRVALEPLSYQRVRIGIPAFRSEDGPEEEQPKDVKLSAYFSEGAATPLVRLNFFEEGNSQQRRSFAVVSSTPVARDLLDFRSDSTKFIEVVATHALSSSNGTELVVRAEWIEREPEPEPEPEPGSFDFLSVSHVEVAFSLNVEGLLRPPGEDNASITRALQDSVVFADEEISGCPGFDISLPGHDGYPLNYSSSRLDVSSGIRTIGAATLWVDPVTCRTTRQISVQFQTNTGSSSNQIIKDIKFALNDIDVDSSVSGSSLIYRVEGTAFCDQLEDGDFDYLTNSEEGRFLVQQPLCDAASWLEVRLLTQ